METLALIFRDRMRLSLRAAMGPATRNAPAGCGGVFSCGLRSAGGALQVPLLGGAQREESGGDDEGDDVPADQVRVERH